jgi:hypothetical protein
VRALTGQDDQLLSPRIVAPSSFIEDRDPKVGAPIADGATKLQFPYDGSLRPPTALNVSRQILNRPTAEALNADRVLSAKIGKAKFANVFLAVHGTSPEGYIS